MTRNNVPEDRYLQTEQAGEPLPPGKPVIEYVTEFYHILLDHKWIPIACLLIFVTIAAVYSFKTTPWYQATAQIEIEKESLNLLSFQDVVNVDTAHIDYYNTQYKIMQSRTVAESVAQKLRAAGNPDDAELTRNDVRGMIKISPVRNSRLVDVVAKSTIPEQAARVANMLAETYIEQDLDKKVNAIRAAANKLGKELTKSGEKVDRSEEKFMNFKLKVFKDTNIVAVDEKQKELSKLIEAATVASAERLRREARYEHLKNLSLDDLRHEEEVVNDKLINDKKLEEFKAIQDEKKLEQIYGPKHPKMISAKEELDNIRKEIDKNIQKVVEEVKNRYFKAKEEEERLLALVTEKKQEVLQFNSNVVQYERLQREVQADKRVHDEILKRRRETAVSEETEKSNVRIVDTADVPKYPSWPRKKVIFFLAVVMGLVTGCGGAWGVHRLHDVVEDPTYIEITLARPVLGMVPAISNTYATGDEKGKIAHLSPKSRISEAYKKVLASIQYSPNSDSLKTILVTSAGPAEGKTTTLTNLAICAAQQGKRVLIVDCDLRRPTVHKIFGLKKEPGVTDYLAKEAGPDVIVQKTQIENLSTVARGKSSPNPSGMLSSERMREFVERVRDKYDLVFFDSPPCTAVADPLVLASVLDAVINVTKSGESPKKLVKIGINELDRVKANLIGVVLNAVQRREGRRYYYAYGYRYRYKQYGRYYGDERGEDKEEGEKSEKAYSKPGPNPSSMKPGRG